MLESIESYPISKINNPSIIFQGLTFVFTGNFEFLSRDDAIDYVKILGGRVTTAVSSKTDYLVCGEKLEDGRDVEDGSKHKKASSLSEDVVCILRGAGKLYALAQFLNEEHGEKDNTINCDDNYDGDGDEKMNGNEDTHSISTPSPTIKTTTSKLVNPYAKKSSSTSNSTTTVKNPYAKVVNPYAKASSSSTSTPGKIQNPYAKASSSTPGKVQNPYAKSNPSPSLQQQQQQSSSLSGGGRADINDPNALWADKYAPNSTRMILGNGENVRKLQNWLKTWEDTFNTAPKNGKVRAFNPRTGPFKAALLSGPPGIGKTTTAVLVAEEANRHVLELNASDTRSKKTLEATLGDVTGNQVLSFAPTTEETAAKKSNNINTNHQPHQKRCIIMDEVDGMGAGDRSGMSELIKLIKESKVPIICICNDRQSQKIKSLVSYCLDLKYRRPIKSVIARRAVEIGNAEGMKVEYNAAESVAESCGNDIRQVLNCMQMWSNKKHQSNNGESADMTYKDFKDRNSLVNKDEMLRVGLFDAARMIIEGRKGLIDAGEIAQRSHLFKRTDAFFTDYSLMGLLVHQNYLKTVNSRFLKTRTSGDVSAEYSCLEDMYQGTQSMSDFAMVEHAVRGGDQNWGLLPLCSILTVKSANHAAGESGGFLPGYPEFSSWLGKNSTRGKKNRLLQELSHHINYKISADNTELRLGYLPVMRNTLANMMIAKEPRVNETIEFMDEYGLDRDDVFENLDEFVMDQKVKKFADIESKSKAAFTREFNKGIHKSQALVDEIGTTTRKRKATTSTEIEAEDGVIEAESSDEEDEEKEAEELRKLFQKKPAASRKKITKTTAKKGKKAKK